MANRPNGSQLTPPAPRRRPKVALAGNPNCGKTSLFNALTGSHQHVANYAGVTVEKRTGECDLGDGPIEVIDLPGTYSLSSYSPEERVAEEELTQGHPDVVVVVADSTQLQRNLVLLAQIMQLGGNPVLSLNMADEARAAGQRINLPLMERLLGFPVVETVAHREQGLEELRDALRRALARPVIRHKLVLGEELDRALAAIRGALPHSLREAVPADWIAVRLLLEDPAHLEQLSAHPEGQSALQEAARQRTRLQAATGQDVAVNVAAHYFGFVDGLLREVRTQAPRYDARQLTDRVDAVVVHPWLGLPIFAAVMFGIFWLTFTVGELPMGWIETGMAWLGQWVGGLWPAGSDSLLRSLLVDGVVGGVGGVLVFLPNIVLLFAGLALLEDTGYMARAAFLTDRVMHRFGLHGKSFIPLVTGFGCSVPGILATRTLENERDRITTILVLPLMSCGARLPIWMLLVPAFFAPAWRAPMLWFIYLFGILLALLLALLLRRTLLRGDDAPFVMELPPYRLPTLRSMLLKMGHRSWAYLHKAGTLILGISILLWAATTFPRLPEPATPPSPAGATATHAQPEASSAAAALEYSLAGRIGRGLEPAFAPLGFDWKIVTALIGAFAAKEVFVSQLAIVNSLTDEAEGQTRLREQLARDYSPLVGLSLMLFLLVATPCMATLAVTRREAGRWRWALLQVGGLTALAYVISLLVYQVGRLIG